MKNVIAALLVYAALIKAAPTTPATVSTGKNPNPEPNPAGLPSENMVGQPGLDAAPNGLKNAIGSKGQGFKDAQNAMGNVYGNAQQNMLINAQNLGAQNVMTNGVQNMMNTGAQNMMSTGAQNMMNTGAQNMMKTGAQNMMNTGAQNMMNTGAQNMMNTGAQNLMNSAQQSALNNAQQTMLQNAQMNNAQRSMMNGQLPMMNNAQRMFANAQSQMNVAQQSQMNNMNNAQQNGAMFNHFQNNMMTSGVHQANTNTNQQSTSHGSSNGLAAILPLLLAGERGGNSNTLLAAMAMKNPALAQLMPAMLMNGGMTDSMMRTVLFMGLMGAPGQQGQGQGNDMMPLYMMMMAGNEFQNMFPFLVSGTGSGSTSSAGTATGASSASASQTSSGPNSAIDALIMSRML